MPGPAFVAPIFQSLWRDAIVYPLWEGGGEIITVYPNLAQNLGTGTFPVWTGPSYLSFTVATPHFIDFPISLLVGNSGSGSGRQPHTLGAVFRTTGTTPQTIYAEGDSADNQESCMIQVRGEKAEPTLRHFYRSGATALKDYENNSDGSGNDYADGEWHAVASALFDVEGSTPPFGFMYADGVDVYNNGSNDPPTGTIASNTVSIGRFHRHTADEEEFDGDIALVVTWKRALTQAEARLFSTDPFGMLRPVLRITDRYLPPQTFFEFNPVTDNTQRIFFWPHRGLHTLFPYPTGSGFDDEGKRQMLGLYPHLAQAAAGPRPGSLLTLGVGR